MLDMSRRKSKNKKKQFMFSILIVLVAIGTYYKDEIQEYIQISKTYAIESYDMSNIPQYSGNSYVVLNDNKPNFTDEDYLKGSFEEYSELDTLGRCGVAYANVSVDTMPTEERGSIGQIKPSGWHTVKYDIVNGKYLYNRCHLIGYQLTGENANPKNLITCTRSMNTEGMLEFENQVADYVKETICAFYINSIGSYRNIL